MAPDTRRAEAAFELTDGGGSVRHAGTAEAVAGDDALRVGSLVISWLDADAVEIGPYRIVIDVWPDRRLVLSQLGRRFETFAAELRRARNHGRVAGLLAHGVTMPAVFTGALLSAGDTHPCDVHVYDTHLTIVPADGEPWQVPLGALASVQSRDDPPAVVVCSEAEVTTVGQLGRARDACRAAILNRRDAQLRALAALTGQDGFSDGGGVARSHVRGFTALLERFTSAERSSCRDVLLAMATAEPRMGFVQLVDPDPDRLQAGEALPDPWALFVLVPCRDLTILEILAGPPAATYVFRAEVAAVNRDLQLLHFRRAPLALTGQEAEGTPFNPFRLALRRLEPLRRLRVATVARVIHNEGWQDAIRAAVV